MGFSSRFQYFGPRRQRAFPGRCSTRAPPPHRGRTLTATNTATGVERATTTNDKGFFAFPSLPAGRYEFKVDREGFSPPRLTILVVDDHSALQTDTTLPMIEKIEQVTVLANDVYVETSRTQASEVVTGPAIKALHDRSFRLMALEPGVVPMTIELSWRELRLRPPGFSTRAANRSAAGGRTLKTGQFRASPGPAPVSRSQFRRIATIP
jgi:Carboxypeptidase regulatory-like domain